jgi:hypothetical protein
MLPLCRAASDRRHTSSDHLPEAALAEAGLGRSGGRALCYDEPARALPPVLAQYSPTLRGGQTSIAAGFRSESKAQGHRPEGC